MIAPLRIVIGPTAAGKSAIAMHLAASRRLTIISADSRQLYRGFDIGTAKPTAADRAAVPHVGIDMLSPDERYSAHRFAADAAPYVRTDPVVDRTPLVVGGTGFYVRALVEPLARVPAFDQERRQALGQWLDAMGAEDVERWAYRLDPARAQLGRTQRLRAIETALLSGERLSERLAYSAATTTTLRPVRYLVVDPGPVLEDRLRERVHAMVRAGWFDEVEHLLRTIPPDAPAWNASGYAAIRSCLEGTMTRADAIDRVIIETRQYAKRQRTWCRHQLRGGPVTLLNPDDADATARADAWFDDDAGQPGGDT